MSNKVSFLECTNPDCRFRFPLDLSIYEGKFCPRCGANLGTITPQIDQWQPGWEPNFDVRLVGVLDNIRSAQNVGSIFRTSEAVNLHHLYLCGLTPTPASNIALIKSSLGSEERVAWSVHNNAVQAVNNLKSEGWQIIALECHPQAQNLFSSQRSNIIPEKVALVVGNEPAGIDPGVLELADQVLYIPMAGQKTSINVAVAYGVAVYGLISSWSTLRSE